MNHNCGIVGFLGEKSSEYIVEALMKLEHRGQEAGGIVSLQENELKEVKKIGLVSETFTDVKIPESSNCVGHTRYSTTKVKESNSRTIQPFISHTSDEIFSFCHNGHIPMINEYIDCEENSDSYGFMQILKKLKEGRSWKRAVMKLIEELKGSYSIIIQTRDQIIAFKDSFGIRPLCYGLSERGIVVASESSVFPPEFEYVRELNNGEILIIRGRDNIEFLNTIYEKKTCCFEHIYFYRHKSLYDKKKSVEYFREVCGLISARKEEKIEAKYVVYMPSTSIPSAISFSRFLSLELKDWIRKRENGFTKRTFILSNQDERMKACLNKFEISDEIVGKNIYLIDDSIVRGNTMKTIVKLLKEIGVGEIHLRIMSPIIKGRCYYGIDMSNKDDLIGSNKTEEEIRSEIGISSLKYLEIQDIKTVLGDDICTSCFTGEYDERLIW